MSGPRIILDPDGTPMREVWRLRKIGEEIRPAGWFLANSRNWRIHPTAQRQALKGALNDLGWLDSVKVNLRSAPEWGAEQGVPTMWDGHCRIEESLKVGEDTAVPLEYYDLTPAEEAEALATFDPLSALAGTDTAQLDALLREVSTGEEAVQQMLATLAEEAGIVPPMAEVEDEPAEIATDGPTRCQPGDVWRVGRHTVACLDSTDRANVECVLAGRKARMVWADPPYGVQLLSKNGRIGSNTSQANIKGGIYAPIIGDNSTATARKALEAMPAADVRVWWGANYYADALPPSPCWLVWDKTGDMPSNNYADCEFAWTNLDSPARIYGQMWRGMIREGEHDERVHPNQKPIALCVWAFEKYGNADDLIVDPFLGSGPSLKAAEQSGRTVVGFELSPHYVDHILEWAEAHGLTCEKAE